MPIQIKILSTAILLSAATFAAQKGAPGEWRSVHTNEIARWQAECGAKDGVVVDKSARAVTFLVEATGVTTVDPVEFFVIGPLSDRAYESFGVSVASPSAIASALESIGVKRGVPVSAQNSRLWPQGERVEVSMHAVGETNKLSLLDVLAVDPDSDMTSLLSIPLVCTLGARDSSGAVMADTNMPCAVFALYAHAPSILQTDSILDQTSAYGLFRPKRQHKVGDLFEMTVSYRGVPKVDDVNVTIAKDADLASVISDLRERSKSSAVYAQISFASDVPISTAANVAHAFSLVDGAGVRMNGAASGQFYYRAFMPDPSWRAREGRIFQPFEVHIAPSGERTFVYIEEDYSGEGMDPVLKPHVTPFSKWSELPALIAKSKADKVDVLFMFAPASTPVGELTPILSAVFPRITTFYIFDDAEKSPEAKAAK